jgi:hypothetical protein
MSELKLNATCPNCGKANHCQVVSGGSNKECWCFDMPVNTEKLKAQQNSSPSKDCFCRLCLSTLE